MVSSGLSSDGSLLSRIPLTPRIYSSHNKPLILSVAGINVSLLNRI